MEDTFQGILQRYREKQEELYGIIEKELKEVKQAILLVCIVPTASSSPSSSQIVELGDEVAQLRRLVDVTEAWLQRVQEEKDKAIESLKQEKYEILAQLREAWKNVAAQESEKAKLQVKLQEEKFEL